MFDFLDKLFDFDKNGRLDPLEKAARDAAFLTAIEEMEEKEKQHSFSADEDREESDEEWKEAHGYECSDYDREQIEDLEDAGIDVDDFEVMDDDEKREILEENGLDPYDYDVFD